MRFTSLKHLTLMLLAGFLVILLSRFFHPVPEAQDILIPEEEEPTLLYGITVDSFEIITEIVGNGENLSALLSRYGVSMSEIDALVRTTQDVFDVRYIKAGNVICLFLDDSLSKPAYFVYEKDRINYIAYSLRDSIFAWKGEKPVERILTEVKGSIKSSLWLSLIESGASPNLALDLSEIYAWTIDFYAIQPGDEFKLMYEKLVVDSNEIGIGRIPAALFRHAGNDFYAFYFMQDSVSDFFDEKGESLRRTFLKAPLRFSRISSRFSHSRLHPVLRIRRPHHGVDYAAPVGTPVMAIGDGVITKMGWSGGAGRMVKIKHNSAYSTAYLHLSKYGEGIKQGGYIRQGQVIGYVGSSGLSTGPHLDFRFYKNGEAVDPLKVESPPAEPVDSVNLPRFKMLVDSLMPIIDSL